MHAFEACARGPCMRKLPPRAPHPPYRTACELFCAEPFHELNVHLCDRACMRSLLHHRGRPCASSLSCYVTANIGLETAHHVRLESRDIRVRDVRVAVRQEVYSSCTFAARPKNFPKVLNSPDPSHTISALIFQDKGKFDCSTERNYSQWRLTCIIAIGTAS
jgi:hypothetical protein